MKLHLRAPSAVAATMFVLLGLAYAGWPGAAHAVGQRRCVVTTYFSDAKRKDEVGQRGSCPGFDKWGRISQFFTTSSFTFVQPGPGQSSPPGSVPCDFRAGTASGEPPCLYVPTR
jgi:hypothetical protein